MKTRQTYVDKIQLIVDFKSVVSNCLNTNNDFTAQINKFVVEKYGLTYQQYVDYLKSKGLELIDRPNESNDMCNDISLEEKNGITILSIELTQKNINSSTTTTTSSVDVEQNQNSVLVTARCVTKFIDIEIQEQRVQILQQQLIQQKKFRQPDAIRQLEHQIRQLEQQIRQQKFKNCKYMLEEFEFLLQDLSAKNIKNNKTKIIELFTIGANSARNKHIQPDKYVNAIITMLGYTDDKDFNKQLKKLGLHLWIATPEYGKQKEKSRSAPLLPDEGSNLSAFQPNDESKSTQSSEPILTRRPKRPSKGKKYYNFVLHDNEIAYVYHGRYCHSYINKQRLTVIHNVDNKNIYKKIQLNSENDNEEENNEDKRLSKRRRTTKDVIEIDPEPEPEPEPAQQISAFSRPVHQRLQTQQQEQQPVQHLQQVQIQQQQQPVQHQQVQDQLVQYLNIQYQQHQQQVQQLELQHQHQQQVQQLQVQHQQQVQQLQVRYQQQVVQYQQHLLQQPQQVQPQLLNQYQTQQPVYVQANIQQPEPQQFQPQPAMTQPPHHYSPTLFQSVSRDQQEFFEHLLTYDPLQINDALYDENIVNEYQQGPASKNQ